MFNVESLERADLGESLLTWVSALAARPPPGAGPPGRDTAPCAPPQRRGPAPGREGEASLRLPSARPGRGLALGLPVAWRGSAEPFRTCLASSSRSGAGGLGAARCGGGLRRLSSASAPRKQRNRHGAAGRAGGSAPRCAAHPPVVPPGWAGSVLPASPGPCAATHALPGAVPVCQCRVFVTCRPRSPGSLIRNFILLCFFFCISKWFFSFYRQNSPVKSKIIQYQPKNYLSPFQCLKRCL